MQNFDRCTVKKYFFYIGCSNTPNYFNDFKFNYKLAFYYFLFNYVYENIKKNEVLGRGLGDDTV